MNQLITNIQTMSTVEIAKLTGKRHDNVMRKAKELADKGIICAPQIEERYGNNNLRSIYHLNKTESLNLVANLSPEFTAKIIDRWQELEQQTPRLTTPDERAGLRQAVTMLTTKRGLMHDEAYRLVHQRFNVGSIDELTHEQLPEAVEYVHRLALSGELLPREDKDAEREAYIRNHQICAISLMYTGRQRYEEQSTAVRHLCDEAARAMYALEAAKTALNAVLEYGDKIQYGSGAIWDGLHESLFYLHLPDEVMAEGKRRAQEHYKPRITA